MIFSKNFKARVDGSLKNVSIEARVNEFNGRYISLLVAHDDAVVIDKPCLDVRSGSYKEVVGFLVSTYKIV